MDSIHLDSGFGSSIDNGGGSMPEIGAYTVPGDNEGPVSGLGFDPCVYDDDGDQAYGSLGDTLLSLQPESLNDQPLSMVTQNTSDESAHDFQDESNNTSAGGESPDSIATALELSLSPLSTSTTLQSNEDNTAAQTQPPSPSSDKESDSSPTALGLDLEVNSSLEATTAPITGTHEASNFNANRADDTNPDAIPSATLSHVTAQNIVRCREIIIRDSVMEDHPEVINERVLVELSSSPK